LLVICEVSMAVGLRSGAASCGVQAQIAEELGIPVVLQRYWVWGNRQNKTTRPNRLLTAVEEAQTVEQLTDTHMKMPLSELRLFLEAPVLREVRAQPNPPSMDYVQSTKSSVEATLQARRLFNISDLSHNLVLLVQL
jgi:hypothetical protein